MQAKLLADPLRGPQGHFDQLTMADSQVLFRRRWPRQGVRRGALLVHGYGEHSGRYRHIATWLNARGWDVCSYDQRGHGRTPGKRGSLRHPDDLVNDLAAVYADYAGHLDTPPLLFGHSMGGLVAARAVLGGLVAPSALVLSSPALRIRESNVMRQMAGILAHVAPGLPLNKDVQRAYLSHDERVRPACDRDPYCHHRITPRLAEFFFRAGPYCIAAAGRLAVPTLLLAAGDDHVVDVSGSRDFIDAAPAALLLGTILDGLYHEVFNEAEPARSRVFARLGAWLDTRFPVAALRPTA